MFSLSHRGALAPQVRHARPRWLHALKTCALAALPLSLGLVGLAMAQVPPPAPLTLDAALRAAEVRSANLQGQDASIRALHDMAVAAGRLPDPVLRLSVDNLPIDGPMQYSLTDDFMTMRSVSLVQTFTGADKRQARSARVEREADAALATRTLQLSRLRTQTARAWLERYYQQQLLDLLLRQRDAAGRVAEAAESTYRGGRGKQTDVFAARSAVARLDEQLHTARAALDNATSQLTRWVGEDATQPLGALPRLDSTHLGAHTLPQQLEQHPDIALLAARERVALADAELARLEKNADWTGSLMVSKRGSQFGDMVSFGVALPLQWDQKNRQDRELSARLERVAQLRLEREEMLREHGSYVQQLVVNWRSNLARLDDFDKSLIPLAGQRSQASETAFGSGKEPLTAVLEARRMEIDTRIERLRVEKQTAALWAELEYLIPAPTLPTPTHPISEVQKP
jgi:cobalt-zinc-cadmium efflux system outer membrane protein